MNLSNIGHTYILVEDCSFMNALSVYFLPMTVFSGN